MMATKIPAVLRKYSKMIEDISDERELDQGYWVYLKPGLINTMTETHMVHEDTPTECAQIFKDDWIKPCCCKECV